MDEKEEDGNVEQEDEDSGGGSSRRCSSASADSDGDGGNGSDGWNGFRLLDDEDDDDERWATSAVMAVSRSSCRRLSVRLRLVEVELSRRDCVSAAPDCDRYEDESGCDAGDGSVRAYSKSIGASSDSSESCQGPRREGPAIWSMARTLPAGGGAASDYSNMMVMMGGCRWGGDEWVVDGGGCGKRGRGCHGAL